MDLMVQQIKNSPFLPQKVFSNRYTNRKTGMVQMRTKGVVFVSIPDFHVHV